MSRHQKITNQIKQEMQDDIDPDYFDGDEYEDYDDETEDIIDDVYEITQTNLSRDRIYKILEKLDFDKEACIDKILTMALNKKEKKPNVQHHEETKKNTTKKNLPEPQPLSKESSSVSNNSAAQKKTLRKGSKDEVLPGRARSESKHDLETVKSNFHYNHDPNEAYPHIDYSGLEIHRKENEMQEKPFLNTIIAGHVDSGKSTLMGHLSYLLKEIDDKDLRKCEKESKEHGKSSFKFAYVMDQREDERSRGITIDISERTLVLKSKILNIIDAPGHRDFVPKMITGAVMADAAILVADASSGQFESGFCTEGQTKEHARLIKSLGVSQIIVAVNKLDLIDWSEERFLFIKHKITEFFSQTKGKDVILRFIPISALNGDNLISKSKPAKLEKWYQGPDLLTILENIPIPDRDFGKPFRMSILNAYNSHVGVIKGYCIRGKVESGFISKQEKYIILPEKIPISIKEIIFNDKKVKVASAGDVIDISILIPESHQFDNIANSSVVSCVNYPVPVCKEFIVEVTTFENAYLLVSSRITVHINLRKEAGKIKKLIQLIDPSNSSVIKKNPKTIVGHKTGLVHIVLENEIPLEIYKNHKAFGRVALRDSTGTIGVGIITEILKSKQRQKIVLHKPQNANIYDYFICA